MREQGVRLRGEGSLRLPSFLIKMDDVFESYTRIVLQEGEPLSAFKVEDGNKQPPAGAAIQLFSDVGFFGNRDATPDIVFSRNGTRVGVVEVKYKPCKTHPDRDNLNQLLTYALAYNVKTAVLLYPAMEKQTTGVERLGTIQGIECYKAQLNLGCEVIGDEELKLCAALSEIF